MALRRVGSAGFVGLLGLLGALLLGAVLYGAASPQHAAAAKCITCEGVEPGEEPEAQVLTINVNGRGAVKKGTTVYCENTAGGTKTCEKELIEGQAVTLTATPAAGLSFLGWSGACAGTGSCEVTMDEAKEVTATFADVTPPAPPTITSPTSGQVFEGTSPQSVSVSFNNGGDASTAAFLCRLDVNNPSGAVGCSSPWNTGSLSAGQHTVYIWAKDAAGNISSPAARSFEVVINSPGSEEEGGSGEEKGKEPPKEEGGPGSGGGGTPGTGTATSTSPPPGIAPAIAARAVVKSHLLGKATVLRKLALKGLPAGAHVAATCKGKGCPFKRKQVKVVGGVADLTALFTKRKLGAGTLIELKATAPGMTDETFDVKTRPGKAPKVTTS
ncbi:MAG: InlB B-repeat-containing protein [Solirubrobacterales bacterium]